jgi:hypothetical protein
MPVTAADYPIIAKTVEGYVQANFSHRMSLLTSGIFGTIPRTNLSEGNTWQVRGRVEYHAGWQTPATTVELTVNDLSHYKDIGLIFRRADAFGFETAAAIAGGDAQAIAGIGDIVLDAYRYNLENTVLTYMLPGLFNTGGPLADTTQWKRESGTNFSTSDISLAKKLMKANAGGLVSLLMHPDVFYGNEYDQIVTAVDYATINEFNRMGINYGGMLGGAMVILNDLCYNSGTTYHSYLCRNGAGVLGFQKDFGTEADRNILLAGGTDILKYDVYFSPHINGTSFTGTAPTLIGGATDAAALLGTNWSLRKDQDGAQAVQPGEIGIICIQTEG